MTKTIEEAAKQAIIDNNFFMADPNHPEFVDRGLEQMRACKWVINHIFSLPLASRLTSEEKERVRANYADAKDIHLRCVGTMSKNHIADLHNEYNKGLNMGIMIVLKHLFGSDFFKEGE